MDWDMDWSLAADVLNTTQVPAPYSLTRMAEQDVEAVSERLALWYPDIRVGMESPHLSPAFYHQQTTLIGSVDRSILPLVIRHAEDGVIAAITYEKDRFARSITSRLGVLCPEHRGAGLALLGPLLLERIGRAIGAELAYYFATLKTRHQQAIAERMGYALVGIVPGYDRDMVGAGEIKRVYEAIYAKLLVEPDLVKAPERAQLTARTRALWDALFGPAGEG